MGWRELVEGLTLADGGLGLAGIPASRLAARERQGTRDYKHHDSLTTANVTQGAQQSHAGNSTNSMAA